MDDLPTNKQELIEASLIATEFFQSLEECDSKRVDDFWTIINETVLHILNLNGRKVDHE